MALWNYCAICGKRIEVGEPCIGIEKKNTEIVGYSICFDCVKVENINGLEKTVSISELLLRAHKAESEKQKLCEDANHMKDLLKEAEERAEKAEERANRWEEEVKAYSESELAKAHDLLSADWAKQKIRADEAEFRLKESEEEIKRLKEIMKGDGIVFIPSKYPGGRGEWNF